MKFAKLFLLVCLVSGVLYFGSQSSAQSQLLGLIEANFCNYDTANKELDLTTQAGKEMPICVEFTNKATIPITLNTEFLDSVITDDNVQNRACNAADRPKTQFGNFLLPYDPQITLKPQETIQKEYIIRYPVGFEGISHGCLAYSIAGADIQEKMFTVVMRSVRYVDMYVSSIAPVQALSISQSPEIAKIGDEYVIRLGLHNQGNVDERIRINGALSNIFGYQKEFDLDATIPANSGMVLATPSFVLPFYKGLFLFQSKISYQPQFDFNITDGKDPTALYAGGTKKLQTVFFIWSRRTGVTLLIFVLIVFAWIRRSIRKLNH